MVQIADSSLEERLRAVENQLRSLTAGNITDLASVQNAQGEYVPLSDIAFGFVAAESGSAPADAVTLTSASDVGFGIGVGWQKLDNLSVDVKLASGRLQVQSAADLEVTLGISATAHQAVGRFAYALIGPTAAQADLDTAPDRNADYTQQIRVTAMAQTGRAGIAAANWGVYTGLAPGWYRVQARYTLTYTNGAPTPAATFSNRRLGAAPY